MKIEYFKKSMLFWSICFFGVGVSFILFPHEFIQLVNDLGTFLGAKHPLPQNTEYFWLALAGSLMMTISYLSYEVSRIPSNTTALYAVLLSKIMSSIFFAVSAFRTHELIYLIGVGIDFSIFLIILFSYQQFKCRL